MSTATANEPVQDLEAADGRQLSAVAFRARQFAAGLSREQRATVATRPRFYSMPWVRLLLKEESCPPDDDLLF